MDTTIESLCRKLNIDLMQSTNNLGLLRKVNRLLRDRDESHLYPICGRYNVTNRAIRFYSRVYFRANGACTLLEYVLGIQHLISEYVNQSN